MKNNLKICIFLSIFSLFFIIPRRIEFVEWPKDYKNIETGDYVTDITKIKNLGWKPKTNLEEGIKKTFEYYKKYKKYYW